MDDKLVAIPFWANTQLLWYRKSVAEAAGLDMTQPDVGPDHRGGPVAGQADRRPGHPLESLTVWLNALVESAGGHIIERWRTRRRTTSSASRPTRAYAPPRSARRLELRPGRRWLLDGERGLQRTGFESEDAGFMVNWPFVWPRALAAVEAGTLDQSVPDDYGWTLYPQVDEGTLSAPPYGGINSRSARSASTSTSPTRPPSASPATRTRRTTSRPTATRRRPSPCTTTRRHGGLPAGAGDP